MFPERYGGNVGSSQNIAFFAPGSTPLRTLEKKFWQPRLSVLVGVKVTPPAFGSTRTKMTRNIMPAMKTGYTTYEGRGEKFNRLLYVCFVSSIYGTLAARVIRSRRDRLLCPCLQFVTRTCGSFPPLFGVLEFSATMRHAANLWLSLPRCSNLKPT